MEFFSLQSGKDSATIDTNQITLVKCIGHGGFGSVFEAKWEKRRVAVKVCLGNLVLSREIQILSSLSSHSNVIRFYGVALSPDSVATYIVTELAPNGSLSDYLHVKNEDVKEKELSLDQSFAWALQIGSGMEHLHNNDVVHRDLKSGNILLSFGMVAKVCDFGTARTLAKTAMTTKKGTYRWMAPEIMKGVEANINKMCDVFSYGMVLYEIYARKIPYDDLPTDPLVGMAVLQGKRPSVPPTLPQFLHPLLQACWKEEPNQRPQFEAIVMAMQTGVF